MLRFIKTHQPIFEQMLFGVTPLPLESPPSGGDLNRQRCKHIEFTIVRHRPLLRYLFSSIITHDDLTSYNYFSYLTYFFEFLNKPEVWAHFIEQKRIYTKYKRQYVKDRMLRKRELQKNKHRCIARNSIIKEELVIIDFIPDDNDNSVIGKQYRYVKNKFNSQNHIKN